MSDLGKLTPAGLSAELAKVRLELLAGALSLLPVELLLAARLGVEVGHLRAGRLIDEDYAGGRWHRHNVLPAVSVLEKLRWPPDGDRAAWVRNGPPGHVDYVPGQAAA